MSNEGGPRYAIYFTPPQQSALWIFGTRVIGYDSYTGRTVQRDARLAAVLHDPDLSDPARYGFHATLRAPFELKSTSHRDCVLAKAHAFSTAQAPVPIGDLHVTKLSGFLALVCAENSVRLSELAAACVRDFELLRAPLTPADRARRLGVSLTARQRRHLDDWGYPYVFDDFTFHMTLTGRLNDRASAVLPLLQQMYDEIAAPMTIDAISVLEQPHRSAPFRVIGRFALRARLAR